MRKQPDNPAYGQTLTGTAESLLANRPFVLTYGGDNNNVWDFMSAVCQNSWLLSNHLIPAAAPTSITLKQLMAADQALVDKVMAEVLADAVDSIAKVWFHVWEDFEEWRS